MRAAFYDLTIEQGATFRQVFRWQDKSKQPFDLTGYTAKLMLRQSVASPSVLKTLTTENGGIVLGGATGSITLYMSPADTTALRWDTAVYDLALYAPGGDVYRLVEGSANVKPAVTR